MPRSLALNNVRALVAAKLAGSLGRIVRGSFWLMLSRAFYVVVLLLQNGILARALSREAMSGFVLLQGFSILLGVLGALGVAQAAQKYLGHAVAHDAGQAASIIRTAVGLMLAAAAVIIVATVAFPLPFLLDALGGDAVVIRAVLVPFGLWMAASALRVGIGNCFVGLGAYGPVGLCSASGCVGITLGTAVMAGLYASGGTLDLPRVVTIIAVTTLSEVLLGLALLLRGRWRRAGAPVATSTGRRLWVELLLVGITMGLTSFVLQLTQQTTLWVLPGLRPFDEIAVLGVAFRLMNSVSVVFLLMTQASVPDISRLIVRGDKPALERFLGRTTMLVFGACCLVAAPIMLFRVEILTLLFGPPYAAAATSLLILMLSLLVQALAGPVQNVLWMSGHERPFLYLSIFTCVLVPALTLALSPLLGLEGGAVALALGITFRSIAAFVMLERLTGLRYSLLLRGRARPLASPGPAEPGSSTSSP